MQYKKTQLAVAQVVAPAPRVTYPYRISRLLRHGYSSYPWRMVPLCATAMFDLDQIERVEPFPPLSLLSPHTPAASHSLSFIHRRLQAVLSTTVAAPLLQADAPLPPGRSRRAPTPYSPHR